MLYQVWPELLSTFASEDNICDKSNNYDKKSFPKDLGKLSSKPLVKSEGSRPLMVLCTSTNEQLAEPEVPL